jgi:hypothetical protein
VASGNYEDVVFDFDGSLELARRLWAFADEVAGHMSARAGLAETAGSQWLGPFGEDFVSRRIGEEMSAQSVIETLRSDALGWAIAWKDAMDEQNRRLHFRHVDDLKNDRNWLEKGGDGIASLWGGGFEDPPTPPPVDVPAAPGFGPTASLVRY